jgi:hypothetical protein
MPNNIEDILMGSTLQESYDIVQRGGNNYFLTGKEDPTAAFVVVAGTDHVRVVTKAPFSEELIRSICQAEDALRSAGHAVDHELTFCVPPLETNFPVYYPSPA